MQFSHVALTDPGRERDHNEDAFWVPGADWPAPEQVAARGALYVVADGMGGHRAGEVASGMAAGLIPRAYYADPDRDVVASLRRAVEAANAAVFRAAQEHPSQAKMGATFVAAVVHDNRLIIVHAGDSRAYLLRGERLHRLTEDHSWVNERLKAGSLTPEEAASHPLRNVVTRALGDKAEIEPTINTRTVRSGDTVLLCTDGLWEPVGEQKMARILSTQPPQQAVQSLIGAANEAGGPDNVTAVVVPAQKKPAATRVLLVAAAALVGLVVVGLLCALSVRPLWTTLLPSLFPTPTPTATATATPTPTPTLTSTPTPTPIPPPDTFVQFEVLGQPISCTIRQGDRIPDLAQRFGYGQLVDKLGHEQVIMQGLIRGQPVGVDETLCLQPVPPYGVILAGEVGLPISGTRFSLRALNATYTVVLSNMPTLSGTLGDRSALWVRVFGLAGDATTVYALKVEGSRVGETDWQPLYSAIPGEGWGGWFYVRANSEATEGLEGLEDTRWGEKAVIVAYLKLTPSATGPGLEMEILHGPHTLDEVTCQSSNEPQ